MIMNRERQYAYDSYKKEYRSFQDDDLAKLLFENKELLDEKYGDDFVEDVILERVDRGLIGEFAAKKVSTDLLDYFDDDDLLDHVTDREIEDYVEDHCYNRVFSEMFERHLRDAEYLSSVDDDSIKGMIISIAKTLTRRPLDKETMKEAINEYIDDNFYGFESR